MSLAIFFDLLTKSQRASRNTFDTRDRVQKVYGLDIVSAQKHPEYLAAQMVSSDLYRELQKVTGYPIRENLARFNVEDLTVTVELHSSKARGEVVGSLTILLSDACALKYSGIAEKVCVDTKDVDFTVHVLVDNGTKLIGYITSDGHFDYFDAPNLRTALAWKIASDGGRVRLIDFFDLDRAAASILDVIRSSTDKDTFFGTYFDSLKRVFKYEQTTRFGDGYCGAAAVLWQVGTREVYGETHDGYSFCY